MYLFTCTLDDTFSIFINDQNVSRFERFKSLILWVAHGMCSSFSWLSKRISLHFYKDRKKIKHVHTRSCACGSVCMCNIILPERGKKRMANLTRLRTWINMDTNKMLRATCDKMVRRTMIAKVVKVSLRYFLFSITHSFVALYFFCYGHIIFHTFCFYYIFYITFLRICLVKFTSLVLECLISNILINPRRVILVFR